MLDNLECIQITFIKRRLNLGIPFTVLFRIIYLSITYLKT